MDLLVSVGNSAWVATGSTDGLPGLLMWLDPGKVAFTVPQVSGGYLVLARFCRELSREAAACAEYLEANRPGGGRRALDGAGDGG